jgi:hypothetical protein
MTTSPTHPAAPAYTVQSCNFSWHAPVPAATYAEALALAKERGWEARIEYHHAPRCARELVAVWSPLYGTKIYSRSLAVSP